MDLKAREYNKFTYMRFIFAAIWSIMINNDYSWDVIKIKKIYRQTFTVDSTQTDFADNMKPSQLLGRMQDAAGNHSNILGIGREKLMNEHNAFWMLVRLQYRLFRPIHSGEMLTVETWARSIRGAITLRDFAFYVDGICVGDAQSGWITADYETRKILRPANAGLTDDFLCAERSEGEAISTLNIQEELPFSHERRVELSDLDVNCHLNNTKYGDIVFDALSADELKNGYISWFRLNFQKECLLHETVKVSALKNTSSTFVCGDKNGERCFEAEVEISPNKVS